MLCYARRRIVLFCLYFIFYVYAESELLMSINAHVRDLIADLCILLPGLCCAMRPQLKDMKSHLGIILDPPLVTCPAVPFFTGMRNNDKSVFSQKNNIFFLDR